MIVSLRTRSRQQPANGFDECSPGKLATFCFTMKTSTNTSHSFFNAIEPAPPDAILGLNEAFKSDPNPDKINLTVGVYQNEQGKTPVFECIQVAEKRVVETETNKSYLGINGTPEYAAAVQELLFGAEHEIVQSGRAVTAQSPGGTGALRTAADLVKRQFPAAKAWFSKPTWANHPAIFSAAGLEIDYYQYLDQQKTGLDFPEMISSLEHAKAGDLVVLHGCCHNPTAVDLSSQQWQELAEFIKERRLLPLVDCAYQGFSNGLTEDTQGIHALVEGGLEVMICSSFSKNLGLYGERVGAMTLVAENKNTADAAMTHIKSCIRVNYSNPPKHGAALATIVLTSRELTGLWHTELEQVRSRIKSVRTQFVTEMNSRCEKDFSFIQSQNGMFSFSGLTPVQVDQLRNQYSIYIVGAGRINVAGINDHNIGRLCDCIAKVL
jgi:aspartate aminotransferase